MLGADGSTTAGLTLNDTRALTFRGLHSATLLITYTGYYYSEDKRRPGANDVSWTYIKTRRDLRRRIFLPASATARRIVKSARWLRSR